MDEIPKFSFCKLSLPTGIQAGNIFTLQLKGLCCIKVLIKFTCRISSHSLRIETGRYEREKLQCGKIVKLHASKIQDSRFKKGLFD